MRKLKTGAVLPRLMTRFALGLGIGFALVAIALPVYDILRGEEAETLPVASGEPWLPEEVVYLTDDMEYREDMSDREERRPSLPAPPQPIDEMAEETAPELPVREVREAPIFSPSHDRASLAAPRPPAPRREQPEAPQQQAAAAPVPEQKPATITPARVTAPAVMRAPAVSTDKPLWQSRAVAVSVPQDRPRIAIVLDDMGLSPRKTTSASALPGPITLAFLPYGHGIDAQVSEAREHGHEIMLHMPMQPGGDANPGPDALKPGLSQAEVERRLMSAIKAVPHIVGFNNHMGSDATEDPLLMKQVAEIARREGLILLDSRTTALTAIPSAAEAARTDWLERDVFLDNQINKQAIDRQLTQLENIARQTGQAIAIGHPHPETIDALRQWLPQARSRGFAIVPVSHLMLEKKNLHLARAR